MHERLMADGAQKIFCGIAAMKLMRTMDDKVNTHTTSTLTSGITRDDEVWDSCECESMIYGAFFRCPFICGSMQILYMQYKNGLQV